MNADEAIEVVWNIKDGDIISINDLSTANSFGENYLVKIFPSKIDGGPFRIICKAINPSVKPDRIEFTHLKKATK